MANRIFAGVWRYHQFLRPHQPVGFPGSPACLLRPHPDFVWLFGQRLQLELCGDASPRRLATGPAGGAPRGQDHHILVERGVVLRGALDRAGGTVCREAPSGRGGIAHLSGKRQGHRPMVSGAGEKPGYRRHRCSGKAFLGDRRAAHWHTSPAFWLALEFRRHRFLQPDLFWPLLPGLSRSGGRTQPAG